MDCGGSEVLNEFVLDASVSLSWCLEDEHAEYSGRVLRLLTDATAVVPGFWASEVANGLLVAERRGRTTPPMVSEEDPLDPEVWQVVPDTWDRQHSAVCWNHICEYEDHGFPEAHLNDQGDWVCPLCSERYFAGSLAGLPSQVVD